MWLLLFPLSTDCLTLILSLCARIYLILWFYLIALVFKKQIVTECSFSLLFYSIFEQGVGRAFWCVCFTEWKASDKIYHQVTHRYDRTRCLCPCQRHWVTFRKKYMRFTVLWTSTKGYNVLIRCRTVKFVDFSQYGNTQASTVKLLFDRNQFVGL